MEEGWEGLSNGCNWEWWDEGFGDSIEEEYFRMKPGYGDVIINGVMRVVICK